jgi:hypothetical protein
MEDDESDEPELRWKRASVPGSVIAAGIIWIIFGFLSVAGAFYEFYLMGGNQAVTPPASCTPFCAFLIGGVFVHVGEQSVRGRARDVLGNGIGSLLFGALYTVAGVIFMLQRVEPLLVAAAVAWFLAAALYVAGILALAARTQYKAYRRTVRPFRRERSAG